MNSDELAFIAHRAEMEQTRHIVYGSATVKIANLAVDGSPFARAYELTVKRTMPSHERDEYLKERALMSTTDYLREVLGFSPDTVRDFLSHATVKLHWANYTALKEAYE
jgi:hypothetical protein